MKTKETTGSKNWKDKSKIELLELVYDYASNGLRAGKSKVAKDWLKAKKLSIEITMACFNSGQLHHRKEKEFKESLERIGFIKVANKGTNCDSIPYSVFGGFAIMFPLRNQRNEIVNFYSVGIKNDKTAFMNLEGLYPGYPNEQTRRLFVVDNVMDAATILEAKILDNREAVMSLYDGVFLDQHLETIKALKHLTEVIQIKNK
jgi:hypothetical protein